jgi:hypothetical protein
MRPTKKSGKVPKYADQQICHQSDVANQENFGEKNYLKPLSVMNGRRAHIGSPPTAVDPGLNFYIFMKNWKIAMKGCSRSGHAIRRLFGEKAVLFAAQGL